MLLSSRAVLNDVVKAAQILMTTSKVSDSDRHEWQARQFVAAGVQYYIAARGAALAGLMPVSGNLFHHAFEMLLKAGIITKNGLKLSDVLLILSNWQRVLPRSSWIWL